MRLRGPRGRGPYYTVARWLIEPERIGFGLLHTDPFPHPLPEQRYLLMKILGLRPGEIDLLPRRQRIALYLRARLDESLGGAGGLLGAADTEARDRIAEKIREIALDYDIDISGYWI